MQPSALEGLFRKYNTMSETSHSSVGTAEPQSTLLTAPTESSNRSDCAVSGMSEIDLGDAPVKDCGEEVASPESFVMVEKPASEAAMLLNERRRRERFIINAVLAKRWKCLAARDNMRA